MTRGNLLEFAQDVGTSSMSVSPAGGTQIPKKPSSYQASTQVQPSGSRSPKAEVCRH